MSVMERHIEFPFPDGRFPEALGAVIQWTVADGRLPARYVAHSVDNDWMVGDDVNDPNVEGASAAMHIRHLVDRDPTLEQLASLPPGFQARRMSSEDPWIIEPIAWLPDDEPFVGADM